MKKVIFVIVLLVLSTFSLLTWARPYQKVTEYEYEGVIYKIIYLNNDEFNQMFYDKKIDQKTNIPSFMIRGFVTSIYNKYTVSAEPLIVIRDNILSVFGLEQLIKHEIGHSEHKEHVYLKFSYMSIFPFLRFNIQ